MGCVHRFGSPNGAALLKSLSSSAGTSRAAIAGSTPNHSASANWSQIPDPEQHPIEATILLRRRAETRPISYF